VNINRPIQFLIEKIQQSIRPHPIPLEKEVMSIQLSNEKKTFYKIGNFRKKFFTISIKTKDDYFKYLFYLLMIVLALLMGWMCLQTGVSEKEILHNQTAAALYDHLANGTSTATQAPSIQNHLQFVDFLCYCFTKCFNIDSIYQIRHIVAAVFGWSVMFLLGLFLMDLFAWRAAFFGAFFLFISPHFLGNALWNLTDIPFAFFYLLGIFQIYLFAKELPIVKWRRIVYIMLTTLAAISIHVGGFVLVYYLILGGSIAFFMQNPIKKLLTLKYIVNFAKLFSLLLAIGFFVYICYLFYPLQSWPLTTPRHAIIAMFDNQPVLSILSNGNYINTTQLSVGYILKMMQLTIPLVIVLGIIIHFAFLRTIVRTIRFSSMLLLLFTLLFPLWLLSGKTLNFSDGWNIYLMLYPLIIIFAVAGYEGILRKVDDRYTNVILVAAFCLLTLMPLRHVLQHYTNVNVYFNELSGGIHNNFGKYSIDAAEQSNGQACKWLINRINNDNNILNDSIGKINVLTDGGYGCDYYFRKDTALIHLIHADFDKRDSLKWDYFITFANKIPTTQLINGTWEKEDAIKRFFVERKQIVAVIKNKRVLAPEPPAEILENNKIKLQNNR
jgi:hypothetical protein